MRMKRRTVLGVLLTAAASGGAGTLSPAAAKPKELLLKDGQKVLFLGDSITNAGTYVQYVDAYLRTRFPERKFELYNLGLSSETVTGLSEPDHPFPRPDVHFRLEKALARIMPDVVVACYGMNDGIYYPFSEDRFKQYQQGIRKLIAQSRAAGAAVILMTPPPFDPVPLRAKLLPNDAPKFSWMTPYERYNDVLARYSDWLLTLRKEGIPVADPHHETMRFLQQARRADPSFTLAGDGIHPNGTGHALIALAFLETIHATTDGVAAEIDARKLRARRGEVTQFQRSAQGIEFEWTMPAPWVLAKDLDPRLQTLAHLNERLGGFSLIVKGLPEGRYLLSDGERPLGEVTRDELAAGVDMTRFQGSDEPALRAAREAFLNGIRDRERLLSPAWLTSIGHNRPSTPAGLPLDEAQRRAAAVDPSPYLSRLVERRTLRLRLVPVTAGT
jgi:lysophospholipase L1-like esterase